MQSITKKTLFPLLKQYLPENPLIVEAGAFDGKDTINLHAHWPLATIHAFEPVPDIFTLLTNNTASYATIHCHPYALSDSNGSAIFYVSESPKRPGASFQAGSLLKPKERLLYSPATYSTTISVPTLTLDTWAEQNAITHIDFLWLDMQGYELNVLKSAPQILPTVQAIYTEVEFVEAYEGQYLYHDVKQWLEEQNFVMIARDFTDQPTWFFGNALFVKR